MEGLLSRGVFTISPISEAIGHRIYDSRFVDTVRMRVYQTLTRNPVFFSRLLMTKTVDYSLMHQLSTVHHYASYLPVVHAMRSSASSFEMYLKPMSHEPLR